jgi:hypothetical protein
VTSLYEPRPFPTIAKPILSFHVWSRVYPSPNRTYVGQIWASSPSEAAAAARELAGPGRVIDIQARRHSGLLLKSA